MDIKEKYGLSKSVYEIVELGDLYAMKSMANGNVPKDYGTGELYTSAESHMITMIHMYPGITAREIAQRTARTPSAVSQILAKLQAKGLIKTDRDAADNRRTCLFTTEKGRILAKAHMEYDERATGPMIDKLIATYGKEAMENFLTIFSAMTYDKGW